jgi:hypothetical protein
MPDPLVIIRTAMTADTSTSWSGLVGAIAEVAATPSPAAEQLLLDLLTFQGPLSLAGGSMPHSQAPEDMIRTAAIDALWEMSGEKYAAVCRNVAAATPSPIVKRIVAARFPG